MNTPTKKIVVIYHRADFDGIFCREIARKFLGDEGVEYIGWDYKDAQLAFPHEAEIVYVLDLSPECFWESPLRDEWRQKLVWIDHHKSAIEKFRSDISGWRVDGVAACRLVWQYFWLERQAIEREPNEVIHRIVFPNKPDFIDRKVDEPWAVRLAGEHDVWDHRDPDALLFQSGMRSREITERDWAEMLELDRTGSVSDVEAMVEAGVTGVLKPDGTLKNHIVIGLLRGGKCIQYSMDQAAAEKVRENGYIVEFEGLKFLTLNTSGKGSSQFAARDLPETGHDALLKYHFNGHHWEFSLYHARHRTDLDLSIIAVKHGGGGHRGACGFKTEKLPF